MILIAQENVRALAADLAQRMPPRANPATWPDVRMMLSLVETAERRLAKAGVPPEARAGWTYSFAQPGPPPRYGFPKNVPLVRIERGQEGWTISKLALVQARPGEPMVSNLAPPP